MSSQQKTMPVLIVDDDSDHANSLAVLVREFGYDSQVCLHAKDCMAIVERLRPPVILLDLAMPEITGFDIAYEIKHNPDLRPARLVAVTGYGQESDRQETQTWGFDHHLLKPVNLQELEAILRTAQRMQQMGDLPDSEIRVRAYAKWEAAGRPGSEEEKINFWYAAKKELLEERLLSEEREKIDGNSRTVEQKAF